MNDIISLITIEPELDGISQEIGSNEISKEVFAKGKGVSRSEYFNARQAGLEKIKCFEIREADYSDEMYFKHDDKKYHIYRVYPTRNEMIELYGEHKN
jgi:SPP1 family predicted phage head-tail adaptor